MIWQRISTANRFRRSGRSAARCTQRIRLRVWVPAWLAGAGGDRWRGGVMEAIVELTVAESFGQELRVRICEQPGEDSCRYEVRADTQTRGQKDQPRRYAIEADHIQHWLDTLEQARVPAAPPSFGGCDGTIYTLSLRRGMNAASYTWWLSLPPSYRPLILFSNELLKLARLEHRIALHAGGVE